MACSVFPSPACVCVCRCNLASVMLQLMALGIPDVMNFDFMSKPSPGKIDHESLCTSGPGGLEGRSNLVCLSQRLFALLWSI